MKRSFAFLVLVPALVFALFGTAHAQDPLDAAFERGVEAYRRGAHGEAESVWTTLFEAEGLSDAARARLAHDLGNVAWRADRRGDAVGWYTVAVRLAPRDAAAWRNLEFARGELGMEPHDRGDLGATWRRLVGALVPAERRNLAAAGLALLLVVGGLEILLGGRLLRRAALAAGLLAVLAAVPWFAGLLGGEDDPLLVVAERAPKLRSEPSLERSAVADLVPGEVVERVDEHAGWVRVEADDDRRGWVPADAVFALERR